LKSDTQLLYQTLLKSSNISISDCYSLDTLNLFAKGRYSEIYESPTGLHTQSSDQPETSASTDGDLSEKSLKSDHSLSTDRAIKLVRKRDYAMSVVNREERSCTLLREIVLLWRGNYKEMSENEEENEENEESTTFDKPFLKIYGLLETRSCSLPSFLS
jgi:hypothetical protein